LGYFCGQFVLLRVTSVNFGVVLGSLRGHFRHMRVTLGLYWGRFCGHFGVTFCTIWGRFGVTLEFSIYEGGFVSLCVVLGNFGGEFRVPFGSLWDYFALTVRSLCALWGHFGITLDI
jgi:hypothetical protein